MKRVFRSFLSGVVASQLFFSSATFAEAPLSEIPESTASAVISIEELPDEIPVKIFQELDFVSLSRMSLANRHSYRIASDSSVMNVVLNDLSIIEKIAFLPQNYIQHLLTHQSSYREFLLKEIFENDIKLVKELIEEKKKSNSHDPNKVYLASFYAKYVVNLSAART